MISITLDLIKGQKEDQRQRFASIMVVWYATEFQVLEANVVKKEDSVQRYVILLAANMIHYQYQTWIGITERNLNE